MPTPVRKSSTPLSFNSHHRADRIATCPLRREQNPSNHAETQVKQVALLYSSLETFGRSGFTHVGYSSTLIARGIQACSGVSRMPQNFAFLTDIFHQMRSRQAISGLRL